MIYRSAVSPAGLPLEVACLWKAFSALHPRSDPMRLGRSLQELFGWETPDTDTELLRRGFPAGVISSELESIGRMRLDRDVKVLAGIEAVRIPRFAIDIGRGDLEQSLREVRAPAAGVVASWNLLNIPDDNLRLLGSWKR
jgi:hypothetical protein